MLGFSLLAQVGDMMDWNGGGWLWMALMMIFAAVVIVVIVFLLVRPFYENRPGSNQLTESPLDIAKRRYAAGEITPEEFERIRRDLGSTGS
ncbi:MAG TPA: SHOCT domain-containing protein [Candidatus Anoxymicrobiaceae bacterium]